MMMTVLINGIRGLFRMSGWLSAIFLTLNVSGQPAGIRLSLGDTSGPKHTDIHVMWNDSEKAAGSAVRFGIDSGNLTNSRKAVVKNHNEVFVYKVVLQNLSPSSTYYYQCGSDVTGWSEILSFRTAPETGDKSPVTIAVFGDTQNNEFNEDFGRSSEIVGLLAARKPDLTLHMGDMVNNGSVEPGWIQLLNAVHPLSSISPLMPTLGNHDIENNPGDHFQQPFPIFHHLFSLPGNGLDYSFNYGNIHFVAVFSGYANKAAESGVLRYGEGSPELKWLENDLSNALNTEGIDWIIVYTHYPVYSFGWSNVKEWRERMSAILDKYHVDLCLSGHRHVYERHHPVRAGRPVEPGKGTVYVTNGTAGGSPQGIGGFDMPTMAFTPRERMYNYAVMRIAGNSLKYEVYNSAQVKIDEFEIVK